MNFPIKSFTAEIEGLGKVKLNELSVKFRVECTDDPTKDTPYNVLLDAGMSEEDINKLHVSQLDAIALEVIEFTYPGTKQKLNELKDMTPDEVDTLKKN